jgi:hypothetical protein
VADAPVHGEGVMRLAKMTSNLFINPDCVASVKVNYEHGSVTIRMADGIEHHLDCDYGKSIWQTHDRIIKLLEETK